MQPGETRTILTHMYRKSAVKYHKKKKRTFLYCLGLGLFLSYFCITTHYVYFYFYKIYLYRITTHYIFFYISKIYFYPLCAYSTMYLVMCYFPYKAQETILQQFTATNETESLHILLRPFRMLHEQLNLHLGLYAEIVILFFSVNRTHRYTRN